MPRTIPCPVERRLASLRAAFDLAPLPGFLFNLFRLEYANNAALRLLEEEALGEGGVKRLHATVYGPAGGGQRVFDAPPRHWRLLVTPAPSVSRSSPDCRACILVEVGRHTATSAFAAFDDYGLTPAQRHIGELLIEGLTNNQIGKRLGIAGETVRKQVARILAKTSTSTRTAFVALILTGGDTSGKQ